MLYISNIIAKLVFDRKLHKGTHSIFGLVQNIDNHIWTYNLE